MKQFLYILFFTTILSSCGINSSMMFRAKKGVAVVSDSIPMTPSSAYKLSKDDKISCAVYSNHGHGLIDQTAGLQSSGASAGVANSYLIRNDGNVELPKIGLLKVAGLTVVECQDTVAKLYSKEYQDPYVQISVTNTRVIIFPGGSSDAKVVILTNANTTLMEVIALAGGINERGKAAKIKLMRNENGIRKIYPIDLSKMENLRYADIVVQANDYIYIEPKRKIATETLNIVAPVFSLVTTIFALLTIANTVK